MANINDLKKKVARCCILLQREGLISSGGHVSARIPGTDHILIHPRQVSRAIVEPGHILTVDMNCNLIEGKMEPPSETYLHTCIYQARPDILSVAHLHSHYATLMSITDKERQPIFARGNLYPNGVSVYPYSWNIRDKKRGDEVARILGSDEAVFLKGHGAVTVSKSIEGILLAASHLESGSRFTFELRLLGEKVHLPEQPGTESREDYDKLVAKNWDFQESLIEKDKRPGASRNK